MRKRVPGVVTWEVIVIQRAPGAAEPVVVQEGVVSARVRRLTAPRAFDRIDGFAAEDCYALALDSGITQDKVGWDRVVRLLEESELYCHGDAFRSAAKRPGPPAIPERA